MQENKQKNVLGEDLEECSNDPLTGWFRDGCCNTDENDHGVHTVCAKVTTEFLEWLKEAGNDLITPHPEFGFPGLKDGDGWCVCASWYARAVEAGKGSFEHSCRSSPRTFFCFLIIDIYIRLNISRSIIALNDIDLLSSDVPLKG